MKDPNPVWWTLKKVQSFAELRSANPKFSLHYGPPIYFFAVSRYAIFFPTVSTSANPVCGDVKTLTSAEIGCGVQTLNH